MNYESEIEKCFSCNHKRPCLKFRNEWLCGKCLINNTFTPYYQDFNRLIGIDAMFHKFKHNIQLKIEEQMAYDEEKKIMVYSISLRIPDPDYWCESVYKLTQNKDIKLDSYSELFKIDGQPRIGQGKIKILKTFIPITVVYLRIRKIYTLSKFTLHFEAYCEKTELAENTLARFYGLWSQHNKKTPEEVLTEILEK